MPELPEVETVVRALRQPLVGRTIMAVRNTWPRHLARPPLEEMNARLRGRRFEAIHRRGKYLLFGLSEGENLAIHLKMTGHLSVVPGATPADRHAHTVFVLEWGDELRFHDPRKFGRVYLVRELGEVVGGLGPEPLEPGFTVEHLAARLHGRRRVMKPLLLDQQFIAGIGNIYADEALFQARIHPTRRADSLSADEIQALHAGIRQVLELGIEREGASIDRYRKPDGEKGDMQNAVEVFQRTGLACTRCGAPVERMALGGRSTHYCPACQR